jgi:hypothetical protein
MAECVGQLPCDLDEIRLMVKSLLKVPRGLCRLLASEVGVAKRDQKLPSCVLDLPTRIAPPSG